MRFRFMTSSVFRIALSAFAGCSSLLGKRASLESPVPAREQEASDE
jgi:hypothetical protein